MPNVDPDTLVAFFEQNIAFNAYLGMKIVEVGEGRAVLKVPYRKELVGDPWKPALHGGVISALVDTAGGLAVFSTLDQVGGVATVDLRVDYLRPGLLEDLYCEAQVIRAGNRVAQTSMRVLQGPDRGHLAAEGRAVYNVLRPDDRK